MDRVSTANLQEPLETILDMQGVAGLLHMVAFLCTEKAAHVRANWQDDHLANLWERAADSLYDAAIRKDITAIDRYNGR